MTQIIEDFSRFSRTEMVIVDGKETFGRWSSYSFLKERPAEENIEIFKVTSAVEGRPDLISNQVYGTPLLDWVLIAFNNARGALNWPKTGDLVEYPVESIVVPEVLQ